MQRVTGSNRRYWIPALAFGAWLVFRPTADGAPRVFCAEAATPAPGTVVMLATDWCPYCARARRFLTGRGVPWCEYDTETSARGIELYRGHGGRGVPIIIVGDDVLHGYDEQALVRLLPAGRAGA